MHIRRWHWWLPLAALVSIGCDDKGEIKIPTSIDEVKQAVTNTVEVAKQTTNMAGGIELQLDKAVNTSGCYAALHLQSGGRPNILQITSYNAPSAESFPSFFLRAQVTQRTMAELAGQTVSGQIYVQDGPNGNVWESPADQLAQLKITAVDANSVSGELTGPIMNVGTGERRELTGKLGGSVKEASP